MPESGIQLLAPPRVLIAEFDEDEQQLLVDAFLELRAQVELEVANDEDALLERLRADGVPSPDLILLGGDALTTVAPATLPRIRALTRGRERVVLVLTTSWSVTEINECYAMGANAVLDRPMRHEELLDMLQRTLEFWLGPCHLPSPEPA